MTHYTYACSEGDRQKLCIYLGVNCVLNVNGLGLTHELLRANLHVSFSELITRRPIIVFAKLLFS
jgi:hypothetical protein